MQPRHLQSQPGLFEGPAPGLPEGFTYRPEFLSGAEEQALLEHVRELPFREFEFHGFLGKRRIVSFGWRYDFNGGGFQKTDDMPYFVTAVRRKVAFFAGLPASAAGSHHRVPSRCRHRLAQGPQRVWRGRGHFPSVRLHFQVAPQKGCELGAGVDPSRTTLGLSAQGTCTHGLGA
jgi:hypothetical protein